MRPSSPTKPPPSPNSRLDAEAPLTMGGPTGGPAGRRGAPPPPWQALPARRPHAPPPPRWDAPRPPPHDDAGERLVMERLLELWCQSHNARAAALYLERHGFLEQQAGVRLAGAPFPETLELAKLNDSGRECLRLPGGWLISAPSNVPSTAPLDGNDPLPVLLASALKSSRLKQVLKEQQFQVNYRVVELENLYDVGLAVAGTLDLTRLAGGGPPRAADP